MKNLELKQAMMKDKADHVIKVAEAVQEWRVLHGNTDAERKELDSLRAEKEGFQHKKDNLQKKSVDLEEKVRILYGQLDCVYENHSKKHDSNCGKCKWNLA